MNTHAPRITVGVVIVFFVVGAGWYFYNPAPERTSVSVVPTTPTTTVTTTAPVVQVNETQATTVLPAIVPASPVVPPVAATPPEPPVEPPSVTQATVAGVTKAQAGQLSALHNQPRQALGLSPLTWTTAIAASAQGWADTLAVQDCPLTHSDTPYGENLYYAWTTGEFQLDPGPAVANWLAEAADYNYARNQCAAGAVCGHYTQVVWANTTHLGCGVATCSDGGRNTQLWVCQYDPAGNDGSRPY